MRKFFARIWGTAPVVSESERELFGGPLRSDRGPAGSEALSKPWAGVRAVPRLVGSTLRMAWQVDRRAVLTVVVSVLGQGVAQAVVLLTTNQALQALLAPDGMAPGLRRALPTLVLLGFAAGTNAVLTFLATAATGRLEPKVERFASERYLRSAVAAELEAIEDGEFRRLIDTARLGSEATPRMISAAVGSVRAAVSLVAVAGVLTVLHPVLLPFLILIVLPRGWGAVHVALHRYVSQLRWIEHVRGRLLLTNLLTGREAAHEVRVHQVGQFLLRHFRTMAHTNEAEQTRLATGRALIELIAAALSGAAILLTYGALGTLLLTGAVDIAAAATAALAINSGSAGLTTLVTQANMLHEESLYVRELDRFAAEAKRRAIPAGGRPLPHFPQQITLDRVCFRYPGQQSLALREVSLTIPAGSVVAIVGTNGSGKSTLVKILAGLYLPTVGSVRWDDVDLAYADRRDVFRHIAVLDQNFQRWPFTLGTNIRIGSPTRDAAPGEIEQVVESAGAANLVAGLPRGLDTLLAREFRGGAELSGGQWQAVAHARVRYRDARMVIADEPTAALDPEAEIKSFQRIRALADEGKTVILVSHRMAGIQDADIIHVFDQGQLVESGPQLMDQPTSRYHRMYLLQARQYVTPTTTVEAL